MRGAQILGSLTDMLKAALVVAVLAMGCDPNSDPPDSKSDSQASADAGAEAAAADMLRVPHCESLLIGDLDGQAMMTFKLGTTAPGASQCIGVAAPTDAGDLVDGVDVRYPAAVITFLPAVAVPGVRCKVEFEEDIIVWPCKSEFSGVLTVPSP